MKERKKKDRFFPTTIFFFSNFISCCCLYCCSWSLFYSLCIASCYWLLAGNGLRVIVCKATVSSRTGWHLRWRDVSVARRLRSEAPVPRLWFRGPSAIRSEFGNFRPSALFRACWIAAEELETNSCSMTSCCWGVSHWQPIRAFHLISSVLMDDVSASHL